MELSPARLLLRLALRSGRRAGIVGAPGRWLGHTWGAPLDCGLHALILDPGEAIQAQIIHRGGYEPRLGRSIRALLRSGRGVFYDVGANIGVHTLTAASTGCRVVAFEPLARLADHLDRSVARNRLDSRVHVERLAVGEVRKTALLYVSRRRDDGSHSLVAGVPAESTTEVRVPVVPLDEYASTSPFGPPTVMKIDVEGYESRVLDGARELLAAEEPPIVILETADRLAGGIGESGASALGRLHRAGYRTYRVTEDAAPLREVRSGDDVSALANYLALPPRHHPEFPRPLRGA